MNNITLPCMLLTAALAISVSSPATANDPEALKIAAVEALMVAPDDKALPVLQKVLAGDASDEIKHRALFVLGQNHLPEARETLLGIARDNGSPLQLEAIRQIGISGDPALTSQLTTLYASGEPQLQEAVLQAFMIAGDETSVLAIAEQAKSDEEFDAAVHMLGVMGATDALRGLRDRPGAAESLIQAYAIAGDTESLGAMALDSSDRERQLAALQGLGIAGGTESNDIFLQIYRSSDDPELRQAVMNGFMVSGHDQGVLELFREATDDQEKADLLRLLVLMDSDAAMDAINDALGGQ